MGTTDRLPPLDIAFRSIWPVPVRVPSPPLPGTEGNGWRKDPRARRGRQRNWRRRGSLLTRMAQFCGPWLRQRSSVQCFATKNPAIWGNLDSLRRREPSRPAKWGNRHLHATTGIVIGRFHLSVKSHYRTVIVPYKPSILFAAFVYFMADGSRPSPLATHPRTDRGGAAVVTRHN